mgnify:CR=1 FL=1
MKKAVLLSILGVILLVSKSEAQHFVTSYGIEQQWGIPYEVYYTLDHDYWGYDIVHASHIVNRRRNYFDIVLQRRGVFVRLSIGRNGRVLRRIVTNDYPLFDHVCNNHCGYHDTFYQNYAVKDHHGHFYVNYRRPRPNVMAYNNHKKHWHGNAYGHNKGYKNHGNTNFGSHSNNGRNDNRRTIEGNRYGGRGDNGRSGSGDVNRRTTQEDTRKDSPNSRRNSTSTYPSRRSNE